MSLQIISAKAFRLLGLIMLFGLPLGNLFGQTNQASKDTLMLTISPDNMYEVFYKKSWRYSTYDSAAMAGLDYDDSNWKTTKPEMIDSSILYGIGWFRIHFTIDSTLVNKPLALSLIQEGASEIYLDGIQIKKFGVIKHKDSVQYYNPQNTPFIVTISSAREHVLAIRYARFHFKNKDDYFGFTLNLGEADHVIEGKRVDDMMSTFFITVLAMFFLTLGFLHFLFYLYYKQNKSNLWFCIFMVCIGGIWISVFWLTYTNDPDFGYKLSDALLIFSCLACVTFMFFIHVLFNNKGKIWLIISLVLLIINLVGRFTQAYELDILMLILVSYASVYGIVSLLKAIINKVKGALILGVGFGFFLVSLVVMMILIVLAEGVQINTGDSLLGQILAVVLLLDIISIPVTMSVYQAWIFARLNRDLSAQLQQVKQLSEITIKQEQEKKQLLESQNVALERMVNERTAQLSAEKLKSDNLLLNILPEEIATELKQNGQSAARQYNHVTVLFTDFVNFTGLSEQMSPKELVAEIHHNFTAFDAIIEKYGLEKIKTIGDAYLAVCGMPIETSDHAQRVVQAAMEINAYMQHNKGKFQIRIGIHTGPVVAGIVGVKKYAYDIWGDTVNTASRMESSSEAGKINISAATYELIKREFACTYRGKINAKNKGEIDMYFVEGKLGA